MYSWHQPPITIAPGEPAPSEQAGNEAPGLLAALRAQGTPWPGPSQAREFPATDRSLRQEQVRSGPSGIKIPWFLPYFDEQQTLNENQAMRLAYRLMLADPNVKAAFLGKLLAVGALDLKIIPWHKKDREAGRDAAFVRWCFDEGLAGGFPGFVWSVFAGGLIDGYSVSEKVWGREHRGEWAGSYYLRAIKPKDTGQDVILETDEFRNVTGIRGLRYSTGVFHPSHFVLWRNLPLWDVATGMSDFRAAYGRWWLLDTALKIRAVGLEKRALPMLLGTYLHAQDRPALENALSLARSQNWLLVPEGTKVDVLNLAGAADGIFAAAIADLKHDIFLAIQGAILQSLEGSVTDGRGSSAVHRTTADLQIWNLSQSCQQLLNDRKNGVIRDLIDLNRAAPAYPRAVLGAVDVGELAAELDIDQKMWSMGVELSREELYEKYGRKPPEPGNKSDVLSNKPPEGGTPPGGPALPPEKGPPVPPAPFSEGPHRFSSTQFEIDDPVLRKAIKQLSLAIPDGDLAGDGRESTPHITVKYGLHTDDAEMVRRAVQAAGPVTVRLGGISVFPATEANGVDVVKVDVLGDDIHRLHRLLGNSLANTDRHPVYRPHLTLAYVKAGRGAQFTGKSGLEGRRLLLSRLIFTNRGGERATFDLAGPAKLSEKPRDLEAMIRAAQAWYRDLAGLAAEKVQPLDEDELRKQVVAMLGGNRPDSHVEVDWEESKHPRGADGRFGGGGGSAPGGEGKKPGVAGRVKAGARAAVQDWKNRYTAAAGSRAARILKATAGSLGEAGRAAARKVVGAVVSKYQGLEKDFGRAGAVAILAACVAAAPIPLPGTVIAPVLAAKGLRALYRWLKGTPATVTPVAQHGEVPPVYVDRFTETYSDDWEAFSTGQERKPGDVWKGPSGRWFTKRPDGRVVPGRDPGKDKKKPAAKPKEKPTPQAVRAAIDALRADGNKATPEAVATTVAALSSLTGSQIDEIKRDLGLKGSGTKAERARKIIERALRHGVPVVPVRKEPPPPLPRFRPPGDVQASEATTKDLKTFFGNITSLGEIAGATNCVDGARVRLAGMDAGSIEIESSGQGVTAIRTFHKGQDGSLTVTNEYFEILDDSPHKGKGVAIFANQVQALRRMGVTSIHTSAVGSKTSAAFNGYYTWPRMGYGGKMKEGQFMRLPEALRMAMGKSREILDLYDLPGGPEAWKEHGSSIALDFDLRTGSRSLQVLAAYVDERDRAWKARQAQKRDEK